MYSNEKLSCSIFIARETFTMCQRPDESMASHAQYDDPAVGRFLSSDTVQGNAQGMDPYADDDWDSETTNDPREHPNDPYLIYVAIWYALVERSGNTSPPRILADSPSWRFGRAIIVLYYSRDGVRYIDLSAVFETFGLLWKAKTGGGTPGSPSYGLQPPDEDQINEEAAKMDYTAKNASGGPLLIYDWRLGSINDPAAKGYDQALAHFFHTWPDCQSGWCTFDFRIGIILHVSVPRDGVITYYLSFDGDPLSTV
jgi:hypothetical protein